MRWVLCMLCVASLATAAELKPLKVNPGELRIVPVEPTPESNSARLVIVFPAEGDIKTSNPVNVEMRVGGYPIGVDSDFPRAKEIFDDREGQAIHVFIDNEPYFAINEAFVDSYNDSEVYFDKSLDFDIPFRLSSGQHIIRAFPVRSYNESLKGDNCFAARSFFFASGEPMEDVDLAAPFLTYNEPQDDYDYDPAVPILLDFYISNAVLSSDGYKVELSVDGKKERVLSRWVPYYIYGLKRGTHTIHLRLIDSKNKPLPGVFNSVERSFRLI